MKDFKDKVQEKAEELTFERYGVEFSELSEEAQEEIYNEAMDEVNNDLANLGDYLVDIEREYGFSNNL